MTSSSLNNATATQNGIFTTDAHGQIKLTNLLPGTYMLTEVKAPDGYVIEKAVTNVVIGSGGDTQSITIKNKKLGGLVINKVDSVTGKPLEGVQFKITYADGRFVDAEGGKLSSNGLYVTDQNGQIILNQITGTIMVTEVQTIPGYSIDENTRTQTVVVNPDDTQTLTFTNTPIGGLIITKSDESSGKRLSGVQFEVRKMNGEIIGTYTTDRNGVIQLPQLDSGWYTVTELKTVSGYQLDTTPQQVEVKDGQTATLALTNRKTSNILLHKVDADTGRKSSATTRRISPTRSTWPSVSCWMRRGGQRSLPGRWHPGTGRSWWTSTRTPMRSRTPSFRRCPKMGRTSSPWGM